MTVSRRQFLGAATSLALASSVYGNRRKVTQVAYHGKKAMTRYKRCLVLGMDGLDPKIVTHLMQQGKLPNFSELAQRGFFQTLQTSNPAMSPVAWTDIATGLNSGSHGIFDFLHRDPKTYTPYISIRKSSQGIWGTRYEKVRQCKSFWEYASEAGVNTNVIRWPVTFPAEKVNGRFISGLGTPDLLGTEGQYSFYTTAPHDGEDLNIHRVTQVTWNEGKIDTVLKGPLIGRNKSAQLPLRITCQDASQVRLQISDGKSFVLNRSEWSSWVKVSYKVGFRRVNGMIRFLLLTSQPELQLYCTPVNLDSANPSIDFTYPDSLASELHEDIGPYHTIGMPLSVHPLSHNRIDYKQYLDLADIVATERQQMFMQEHEGFEEGLLAFVFDHTDRIQHAFWSMFDSAHAVYNEKDAQQYGQVIYQTYQKMDAQVGEVLKRIDKNTLLLLLSDHGFSTFRRQIHINRWLVNNGYMVLKHADKNEEGRGLFQDVDWSRTKAYATGFSSLYVNLDSREAEGIVKSGDAYDQLCKEITTRLGSLTDPQDGKAVIRNTYLGRNLYKGPLVEQAPDIVLGLNPGYRLSWQTALGGAPQHMIEDNTSQWSGDHIFDPSTMPGILLSNVKRDLVNPGLTDIADLVLCGLGLNNKDHAENQVFVNT